MLTAGTLKRRFKTGRAVELGLVVRAPSARAAGVSAQQRWGSSLNLNPHIHSAWVDGVFTLADGMERAMFRALPPPGAKELEGRRHEARLARRPAHSRPGMSGA